MNLKYRPDIDGLRALAVLPVVLFHSGVTSISGGFFGVDVFFVISGFLITKIIISDIDSGIFSFVSFYERRIRRIIPLLLFVILSTSVASLFLMLPYDLKNYGQSVVASLLSANNILLYLTSGYWSASAEFKPLYHTWSLAIEEQYYFIFPIIIFLIYKTSKNTKTARAIVYYLLLAIFVSGPFISSFTSNINHEFSFLLIFTRAWELSAGAIIAINGLFSPLRKFKFSGLAGMLLIILSYALDSDAFTHPGYVTLLPVIGAMLIIGANDESSVSYKILSFKPFVFIGVISYGVYLWHQPILSFVRLSSYAQPSWYVLLAFGLLSIPIAYASYLMIEKPFRRNSIINNKTFYLSTSVLFSLLLAFGLVLNKTYGLQVVFKKYSYDGNPQEYVDSARRFKKTTDRKNYILVVGNSYARDLINILTLRGFSNIIYYEGSCSESIDNKINLYEYAGNASKIFISQDWGNGTEDKRLTFEELKSCFNKLELINKNSYIFGTKNIGYNNNFVRFYGDKVKYVSPLSSYTKFNNLAQSYFGVKYINVLQYMEDSDGLIPVTDDNGKFITYDTKHLTKDGVSFVSGILINDKRMR